MPEQAFERKQVLDGYFERDHVLKQQLETGLPILALNAGMLPINFSALIDPFISSLQSDLLYEHSFLLVF